ncbi:MAG: gamma-glutamylcyclotransferase [Proteobacteria bacterium]|nr:gamma-glutamylcyclotransferase [Pseudomonadota bacterium]
MNLPANKKPSEFLTRDALANNMVQKLARERGDGHDLLSDDELLASRRRLVGDDWQEEIWLFGYGSLLWNPVIHIDETRMGRIYGYRRRFCLRTSIGRGAPGNPGLVLALDQGGVCRGLAMRVSAKTAKARVAELDLLWKREMLNASYQPKWVLFYPDADKDEYSKSKSTPAAKPIKCLSFVINRHHRNYVRHLSHEEKVAMIADAEGFAGPCRDYLAQTHATLHTLGIHDAYVDALYDSVMGIKQ